MLPRLANTSSGLKVGSSAALPEGSAKRRSNSDVCADVGPEQQKQREHKKVATVAVALARCEP